MGGYGCNQGARVLSLTYSPSRARILPPFSHVSPPPPPHRHKSSPPATPSHSQHNRTAEQVHDRGKKLKDTLLA
ncbi:hypothetical protein QL285_046323 [Trifolium repens]|nr:hypothetical protein QL285_046323 [Trifolium repens]